jgi:hypothetical protein
LLAAGTLTISSVAAADLLGSSRGGSAQWDFCYGKPDSTVLPPDPRTLVQPGISNGRAVHFNAFWKNCHVDPAAVQEEGAAQTCGELRHRSQLVPLRIIGTDPVRVNTNNSAVQSAGAKKARLEVRHHRLPVAHALEPVGVAVHQLRSGRRVPYAPRAGNAGRALRQPGHEDRKIYNTNGGHEFNSVLTDGERLALIEYLKTL